VTDKTTKEANQMTTNGKRHKKGAKGHLVSKHMEQIVNGNFHTCTTCSYHGNEGGATQYRVDEYEFITVNVPFCDTHAAVQEVTA
jgi:hypothetical protein